jgi:tetratricopeptide (TPR) repeat protein
MALEMAPAVIHLIEAATGRTVAKLEDPNGDRATWQGFTPDATQLVVLAGHTRAIHIWDLRAIRKRLKDMNLDWEWPEYPLPQTGETTGAPLTIQTALENPAGGSSTPEEKARNVIERGKRLVERNPDSALACNDLAWAYVTVPEALRDAKAALLLSEKAIRLTSADDHARNAHIVANYRNTLGLVYYRAGRFREAVALLRTNLEERQNDKLLPYDLLFLAMCFQRLGETERARDCYECADRWIQSQTDRGDPVPQEIVSFRSEAEDTLRLTRSRN